MPEVTIVTESKINIQELDFVLMKENCKILIVGKRGSGKTTIIKELLKHFKKQYPCIVSTNVSDIRDEYNDIIPKKFIYNDENKIIEKIINRQIFAISKKIRNPRLCVAFDCTISKQNQKNAQFLEIMYNGRHYYLNAIFTVQTSREFSPDVRANMDYIFLLGDDDEKNVRSMYDTYGKIFPTFDMFHQVFKQLTQNFGVMVICNWKDEIYLEQSKNEMLEIKQKVFHFKASGNKIDDYEIEYWQDD